MGQMYALLIKPRATEPYYTRMADIPEWRYTLGRMYLPQLIDPSVTLALLEQNADIPR